VSDALFGGGASTPEHPDQRRARIRKGRRRIGGLGIADFGLRIVD